MRCSCAAARPGLVPKFVQMIKLAHAARHQGQCQGAGRRHSGLSRPRTRETQAVIQTALGEKSNRFH